MENIDNNKKDLTKQKIILFIIGVLTGAVISTAAFFAYINLAGVGKNCNTNSMQAPNGTPPEMPSQGGTPPELPDGKAPDGETPPEIPNDTNNSDSTDNKTKSNDQGNASSSKPNKNKKSQTTNS